MQNKAGGVIWITGLSGVGKSTLAIELQKQMRSDGLVPIHLDGDAMRAAIADPHIGHDKASRLENAFRICRFAKMLSEQGFLVIVSTMSLFKEIHSWNRANLINYYEVLIEVDLEILKKRDARFIYSKAEAGKISNVVGIDLEYDLPTAADLRLNNDLGAEKLADLAKAMKTGFYSKIKLV